MDADKQLQQNIVPGKWRCAKLSDKPQFKVHARLDSKIAPQRSYRKLSGLMNDEHTNGEQF